MEKMTKCKSCGKDIAKTAKSCPNCGAKNISTKGCLFAFIAIAIIAFALTNGGDENKTVTGPNASDRIDAQITSYIADGKYDRALEKVEELKQYSGDVAEQRLAEIDALIPKISAKSLRNEYEENQIKADGLYKDKMLCITGTIADFGVDILNDTYLIFEHEKYTIDRIKCIFSDANEIAKVAELKKGQEITLYGICTGAVMTAPTINNCKLK